MNCTSDRANRPNSVLAVVVLLVVAAATPASSSWLRPVEGEGHFDFVCDVVTWSRTASTVDVVGLVSIPHRELTFERTVNRFDAEVRITLRIVEESGRTYQETIQRRFSVSDEQDVASPVLRQEVVIKLGWVAATRGTCEIVVEDMNRRRPGLLSLKSGERASAQATADWYAPPARESRGLAIGSALYLAHAPVREWAATSRPFEPGAGGPWDFAHPRRQYGLESSALQLYFTVEPPADVEDRRRAAGRPILIRIESDHLDFALVDTVRTTAAAQRALADGGTVAVYWEMDAAGLPPGEFRLGVAPLDTVGRSLLSTFFVVWRLDELARDRADQLGIGRTVLLGRRLADFEAASTTEKTTLLDAFWRENDPTPEDPYNEARAEFDQRLNYVRRYFGGLGPLGANDPRGQLYLLLGEPDEVVAESMPINERRFESARQQVYSRHSPVREGDIGNAPTRDGFGNYKHSSDKALSDLSPYEYLADKTNLQGFASRANPCYELWFYDNDGWQLFLNQYSGLGGELRFLFVDRYGYGAYVLDSDNALGAGD